MKRLYYEENKDCMYTMGQQIQITKIQCVHLYAMEWILQDLIFHTEIMKSRKCRMDMLKRIREEERQADRNPPGYQRTGDPYRCAERR